MRVVCTLHGSDLHLSNLCPTLAHVVDTTYQLETVLWELFALEILGDLDTSTAGALQLYGVPLERFSSYQSLH